MGRSEGKETWVGRMGLFFSPGPLETFGEFMHECSLYLKPLSSLSIIKSMILLF